MKTRTGVLSVRRRWPVVTGATAMALLLSGVVSSPAQAVDPTADLSVSVNASPAPVRQGGNLTFSTKATNAGPSVATKSTMGQSVPSGTVFVGASVSKGTCDAPTDSGLVLCRVGRLSPAESATMSLVVRVTMPGGAVVGIAAARSEVPDPVRRNNGGSRHVQVLPLVADLGLTMAAPTQTGSTARYSMTVTNAGPHAAVRTRVIDFLPRASTFAGVDTAATSSFAKCAIGAPRQLVCQLGRLGPSKTATIVFSVNVTEARGVLTNRATVHSLSRDPNKANNAAVTRVLIAGTQPGEITHADTEVMLTPHRYRTEQGQQLQYTIAVSNAGPDPAPDSVVEDALGDGVGFVSAVPSEGTCTVPAAGTTGTLRCDVGQLDVYETDVVTVTVNVTAPTDSTLVNTASLTTAPITEDPVDDGAIVVSATPVIVDPATVVVNATLTTFTGVNVEIYQSEAPVPIDRASVSNVPRNGSTSGEVINRVSVRNIAYADDWAPPSLDVEFAQGITIKSFQLLKTGAQCQQAIENDLNVLHCTTGPIPVDHQVVGGEDTPIVDITTSVDEATLIAHPINYQPTCYRGGTTSLYMTMVNTFVSATCETVIGISASSIASIPYSSDDSNDANNIAPVPFSPTMPTVAALPYNEGCQNSDFGRFAVLLQQDCDSPVNVITSAGATLVSLAAGATGIAVLDQIVFYTVIAVYDAAECGVLI